MRCQSCKRRFGSQQVTCRYCGAKVRDRKRKRPACPKCQRTPGGLPDPCTCRNCGHKLRDRKHNGPKKYGAKLKTRCHCGNRKQSESKECRRCFEKRPLSTSLAAIRFRRHYQKRVSAGTWVRGGNGYTRARVLGVERERISTDLVFERDRWRCQICGKKTPARFRGTRRNDAPELDHRIPLSLGGPHTYVNVQCACRLCNRIKSNHASAGQLPLVARPV